jgi:hypothetical protein
MVCAAPQAGAPKTMGIQGGDQKERNEMSRMMARPRYRETASTGMKISEFVIIALVIVLIVAGGRYYFFVYRRSPAFVVQQYLAAIKRGDAAGQYALIDDEDKRLWYPTEQDYAKNARQAEGYTERVSSVTVSGEKVDPKKPTLADVDAAVSMRQASANILTNQSDTYTNHFTLRKDRAGDWKVWLKQSQLNLLQSQPNPAGQPL